MNRICFFMVCIASVLILTGCSGNSDKETESVSDTESAVLTEKPSEESEYISENTVATVSHKTKTVITSLTEQEVAATTVTELRNKQKISSDAESTTQNELPMISEESYQPEINDAVTDVAVSENNESSSTAVTMPDDVIELPFVPVG